MHWGVAVAEGLRVRGLGRGAGARCTHLLPAAAICLLTGCIHGLRDCRFSGLDARFFVETCLTVVALRARRLLLHAVRTTVFCQQLCAVLKAGYGMQVRLCRVGIHMLRYRHAFAVSGVCKANERGVGALCAAQRRCRASAW